MTRRAFLSTCTAAAAAQAPRKPNVVVFLSDDMGYADIGPYGAKDIRTPNLDRLAAEGVRFTDFYSNGPVCTPTRAALMTGRWQQRTGLEWALVPADKGKGLPVSETSLARMLKDHGYAAGIFGKWHLGMEPEYSPHAHGFDEWFGLLSGNVDMYSHQYRTGLHDLWENGKPLERQGYLTEMIADRAVSWIGRQASRPFFAYIPFNAVHWPFQGPGRPQDKRTAETWFVGTRATDYKPMLEAMDQAIGRVLQELERRGVARDTLVIFTNDNGGERLSDNRPLFHHKQTLWEGGIRVPALMRWPGRIPAGKTTPQVACTMDLTATILAAVGAAPPRPLDGIDLLPVLRGEKPPVERTLCWRVDRAGRNQKAVRQGDWKHMDDAGVTMLFNLAEDSGERVDLSYRYPEKAQALRDAYTRWEREMARSKPPFVVK
jgi:arylsulfatase A-like enzyme